jgi:hypothetical protein
MLDRRIAVAPMMDWLDFLEKAKADQSLIPGILWAWHAAGTPISKKSAGLERLSGPISA